MKIVRYHQSVTGISIVDKITMVYSNFTLSKVKADFGIVTDETQDIFAETAPIHASDLLSLILKDQLPLAGAINAEKARSELVIMPILMEVR